MYVEPNSSIWLCSGIKLDKSYENSIHFTNMRSRAAWFQSKAKLKCEKYSYVRYDTGVLSVECSPQTIFDCNYMVFLNTAYGDKYFFAFIDRVTYVNDNTARVYFTLDVLQTWEDSFVLHPAFVERTHALGVDEVAWRPHPDEGLDVGDEIELIDQVDVDLNDIVFILIASKTPDGGDPSPKLINGIYTPLYFKSGNSTTLDADIKQYVDRGAEDEIIAINCVPRLFIMENQGQAFTANYTINSVQSGMAFGTNQGQHSQYIPKNKRMYSYPYVGVLVSNNKGQIAEYRPEMWNDSNAIGSFILGGTAMTEPEAILAPRYYRGLDADWDSGVALQGFPQCAWVGDVYKAWMAQHGQSQEVSVGTQFAKGAIQIAEGAGLFALSAASSGGANVIGEVKGAADILSGVTAIGDAIHGKLAKRDDLQNTPPQVHGQTQVGSLNIGLKRSKYTIYTYTITADAAERVDNYFTMYGYLYNKLFPTVNYWHRRVFCYIKTVGGCVSGNIPSDDLAAINAIFDSGIRWWWDGDQVGDYSLDNPNI